MIIIPARLHSTRFKEKVLHEIAGIPMIVRVARQALKVDEVVVAADDDKIIQVCEEYHIRAILTSKDHPSGSDRLAEAIDVLKLQNEIIINVQGDEPFIEPYIISQLKTYMQNHPDLMMASAYRKISPQEALDPNCVKVVVNHNGHALYFSRSLIPFVRDDVMEFYYGHLGIYAYKAHFLKQFCSLSMAPLERQEKLEQLRALYHGYAIGMIEVESQSFGIDTKEDLQKALEIFKPQENN